MDDLALRAGALVLFLAVMGGSVWAAEEAFGGPHAATGSSVLLTSPELSKTASPGTLVTWPVIVRNNGEEAATVHLATPEGAALAARFVPNDFALAPGASRGAWATVDIPASQGEGPLRILAQLVAGKPLASLPLSLAVQRPAHPAEQGEQVTLDYVGRFEDGSLFDTSVRALGEGPFDKPEGFRRDYQPLQVELSEPYRVIAGFANALLGMGVGQSRTVVVPPWEGYGNATLQESLERATEVPRLSQPLERVQHYPRSILTQYLNESSKVGDLLRINDPSGNLRPYRVAALDSINATIVWQVREGDAFTIYPIWPGQSHAFQVTNESVVFRTTPADPDQPLTYYPFLPNATRVRDMNDTALLLDTAPPVGMEFAHPRSPGVVARVAQVTADAVIIAYPNQSPLAGKVVLFDITVRAVQPVFQAP